MSNRFDDPKAEKAARAKPVTLHRGFELFGEQVALVGREYELQRLDAVLTDARARSRARTVGVHGDEGVGKTRVLYEFGARAADQGHTVYRLQGRGRTRAGFPRLAGDLLRQRFELPAILDDDELKERLRDALEDLVPKRRLGDAVLLFGHLLGVAGEVSREAAEVTVQRGIASLAALIHHDAADKAHVVLVDRVDDLDAQDVKLVESIIETFSDRALVLGVSARSSGDIPASVVSRGELLEISGFEGARVEELAGTILARMDDPPVELMRVMVDRGGGRPGAMEQILRTLASRGIVDTSKRPWIFRRDRLRGGKSMPETPEERSHDRLGALDDDALMVLRTAAVLGERFWADALLAVLRTEPAGGEFWRDDRTEQKLQGTLKRLVELDLIHVDATSALKGTEELVFQNAADAKHALTVSEPEWRRRAHRVLARWMERVAGSASDPIEWGGARAVHEREGGHASRAAAALLDAAREAQRLMRTEDAIRLLSEAADLLKEDEGALRYEVLLLLGDVSRQTGQLQRAVDAYHDALLDSVVTDDMAAGAQAYVRFGQALAVRGAYTEAAERIQAGRTLYQQLKDTKGLADALDELGRVIWMRGADDAYSEALTHFLKALSLRRKLGDAATLAESLGNIARIHLGKGYALRARLYLEEALEAHTKLDNRVGMVEVLIGVGATWHEVGDQRRALDAWSKATTLAEEIGDRHALCILLNNMGEAYLGIADHAAARVYLREAREMAREVGEMRVVVDAMRNESMGMLARGEHPRALGRIDEALNEAHKQSSGYHMATCRAARAHILAAAVRAGEVEETSDVHRQVSSSFHEAIAELERIGDDLALARALGKYASYLREQGVSRHKAMQEKADGILSRLRETEFEAGA